MKSLNFPLHATHPTFEFPKTIIKILSIATAIIILAALISSNAFMNPEADELNKLNAKANFSGNNQNKSIDPIAIITMHLGYVADNLTDSERLLVSEMKKKSSK